jgi:pimeloyl-ACP methyl ester carboxylesterase
MGATASMVWWPEEFCSRLASRGFFVIRYDNRDTGQSECCKPGCPNYSVDDLSDDSLSLLTALGIEEATLVGMSLVHRFKSL